MRFPTSVCAYTQGSTFCHSAPPLNRCQTVHMNVWVSCDTGLVCLRHAHSLVWMGTCVHVLLHLCGFMSHVCHATRHMLVYVGVCFSMHCVPGTHLRMPCANTCMHAYVAFAHVSLTTYVHECWISEGLPQQSSSLQNHLTRESARNTLERLEFAKNVH